MWSPVIHRAQQMSGVWDAVDTSHDSDDQIAREYQALGEFERLSIGGGGGTSESLLSCPADSSRLARSEAAASPLERLNEPLQEEIFSREPHARKRNSELLPKLFADVWQQVSNTSVGKWAVDSFGDCCSRPQRIVRTPAEQFTELLPPEAHASPATVSDRGARGPSSQLRDLSAEPFCAVGCVGSTNSLKAFEQRPFDFMPPDFEPGTLKSQVGLLCKAGVDKNGAVAIDQLLFARACDVCLFGLVSALGPEGRRVADKAAVALLKNLLKRFDFRQAREAKYKFRSTGVFKQKEIEHQLSGATTDVVEDMRHNAPAAASNGVGLAIGLLLSLPDELHLTVGVVGGVGSLRVIVATRDNRQSKAFSWRDVTPVHTLRNKEEKARVITGGAIVNEQVQFSSNLPALRTFVHSPHSSPLTYACPGTQLVALTVTRALGFFEASRFGLSAVPDYAEVVLPKDRDSFVFVANSSLWNLMNTKSIVQFLGSRIADRKRACPQEALEALWEDVRHEWPLVMGIPLPQISSLLLPHFPS